MENNNQSKLPSENQNRKDMNENARKTDASDERASNPSSNEQKKHSSAASIDSIISGATDAVHSRMSQEMWGNTGSNISYEGPTAPGAGGSVGTGNASGQDAVQGTINTNSEYDAAREGSTNESKINDEDGPAYDSQESERDII